MPAILISLLGSKAAATAALAGAVLAGILLALWWYRRSAVRQERMRYRLEAADRARRAAEAARRIEGEGAKAREAITADTPESPHLRVRDRAHLD
ncbi:MAG: hypothetical protein U1C74_16820 [Phenylobacterium sp.]|nr:hypothetical protein [Phenylobacterium sp.]